MSDRYGPHSAEVRAILARAEQLTEDEADRLSDAWYATDDGEEWVIAAALTALTAHGRAANADGLATVARRYPLELGAMSAVAGAAAACAAQDDLTPERRDILTRPWHQVIPAVTR